MKSRVISVVTVCRNSENVIGRTIESVLNQTYGQIEYIIVDGLSTDGTVAAAEAYRPQFEGRGFSYRIISEADRGIYDAMNKGAALANGELVGMINSGDWYEPQALERVAAVYEKEGFDLFYADLRIFTRTGTMIKKARLRTYVTTRDWNHPTTFLRRELYGRYHYACRGIYDDWDLVLRIRRDGYKLAVLNEVLADFSFGGISNQKSIRSAVKRGRERYYIYRRNGYSRLYLFECILMETVKYLAS